MSLNDPKWRYLLISSINFSSKISLARLSRAYQPSDFNAEKRKKRKDIFEQLYLQSFAARAVPFLFFLDQSYLQAEPAPRQYGGG